MTPHYDLKQQEKDYGGLGAVLGGGWGVHKHFYHKFWGGGGGLSMFFQWDWGGGGSSKFLPTTWKCNRPPHPVIIDSSLMKTIAAETVKWYQYNLG